ncbi:hypothetical protein QFZ27_006316 [Inquilinus ginsengisoli]|uniref:hypothetical protein n=1 Tax=Inquilinus ginsengisoli TaxID=363840 RepID=UPI003D216DC7
MAAGAEAMAMGFKARVMAALEADDLDRAGKAETHFSSLFRGIRRAIALKARLRRQREDARRKAEAGADRRQDRKDRRRQAVAAGLSQAIAVVKPEARARLTADLWERLTENDRIDADLADTALPIATLIRRLGRQIGLAGSVIAYGLDPALAKARADRAAAGPKPWDQPSGPAAAPPPPPAPYHRGLVVARGIPASLVGGPEGEHWIHNVTTGEVKDKTGKVVRILPVPDQPWRPGAGDTVLPPRTAPADPGGARPPAAAGPPDPPPSPAELDPDEAEFQRQAAYAKQYGRILLRPPALARRLGLPEYGTADGGPAPILGKPGGADKGP